MKTMLQTTSVRKDGASMDDISIIAMRSAMFSKAIIERNIRDYLEKVKEELRESASDTKQEDVS